MTDPLDALRLPVSPLAPDPAFAARLRVELARALADDPGGAMSAIDTPATTSPTSRTSTADPSTAASSGDATGTAGRRPSISAYLAVAGAREAAAWYVAVFDGRLGELVEMPDGRLGHAEVHVGDSVLMMADEFPEMGHVGPSSLGGTSVSMVLDVEDVDASTARAAAAGATVEREPADMPYGFRAAAVVDPFGHRWLVQGPLSGATTATDADAQAATTPPPAEEQRNRPGDIAYVTWRVRDEQRTARFLGELLGWTFAPGRVEHGLQVEGANLLGGLWGGAERAEAKLMYQVADIEEAVAKVRAMGGTATEPELQPYGWSADCTDDQGMEFWITALPED